MTTDIKFFLNICACDEDDAAAPLSRGPVELFGKTFEADYKGLVPVDYKVADDCVKFRVPERHFDVSLGLASRMTSVLIRARPDRLSIQALYDDVNLIVDAACCHPQGSGCECYAPIMCSCVRFVE